MNKILLVEDDFLNRRLCKKILSERGYDILEAKNARETYQILNTENVVLVILDINLGKEEQDGISIGQQLQLKYAIPFVYLTAYDISEIVAKAVVTTPRAYLTKPFKNIDLLTTVELAINQFPNEQTQRPSLLVKDGEYNVTLFLDEITYIEAQGNYLQFYTDSKSYKSRSTIKQIVDTLPASIFIQTHRAYVVNKDKIDKFNPKNVVVSNKVIPISKNYIEDITALFTKRYRCR